MHSLQALQNHARQFEEEVETLLKKTVLLKSNYDILFIGSSSFRIWETMQEDLYPIRCINHGFGGSRIYDSIYYAESLIFAYQPKIICLFSGTNDIIDGPDTKTPEEVFQLTKELIELIELRLPNTKIVYFSMTPTPAKIHLMSQVLRVNQLVESYFHGKDNRVFIDFSAAFLDINHLPIPMCFQDDLFHLNEQGYHIWQTISKPILMDLVRQSN